MVPLGAPKHSLRDLGPEGQTFFDCKHKQLLQMFLNVKRLISRSGEPCGISSFFFLSYGLSDLSLLVPKMKILSVAFGQEISL